MPTNRPFLSNFLAAFRAHSAIQSSTSATATTASISTSAGPTAAQSAHMTTQATYPTSSSTARAINTKSPTTTGLTTAAVQAASHLSHTRRPSNTHASQARSPTSSHTPALGSSFGSRQRRGSDSSSEGGFRDALGNEKWFIGGRTAQGEERFYKLGMVKRERSGDRLSLDRMSL